MILLALAFLSAAAFSTYGARSMVSVEARREYTRYGIPHLRVLNGSLQLLGAVGLLIGLAVPFIGAAAAFGLCVMMLLGLNTRRQLRDAWPQWLPASLLAVLNGVLFVLFLLR